MHWSAIPPSSLAVLRGGAVIPAHLLALDKDRKLDARRQRALTRYYLDAGAGGLAVGVHSTQFAIRAAGLYTPVLELAMQTAREWVPLGGARPLFMIAGLAGKTEEAQREALTAREIGYHAGLLSLAAMKGAGENELVDHCRAIADIMPIVGFYLQPAVGGIALDASFWQRFAEIDNVVAIKMAPFNRYHTLDVLRGVVAARAEERITLYTGNDDHIVLDLLAPFSLRRGGAGGEGGAGGAGRAGRAICAGGASGAGRAGGAIGAGGEGGAVDEGGEGSASSAGSADGEGGEMVTVRIKGGLLGHWSVWTQRAVELLARIHQAVDSGRIGPELLALDSQVTDCNGALFDVAHDFRGSIAGCHEVLRRQGLLEGIWCLDPNEGLSPGQAEEITRVHAAWPEMNDDDFVKRNLQRWLEGSA